MQRALLDPLGVVAWHLAVRAARRGRLEGFLDVDQADLVILVLGDDPQQQRVAQVAQRAAAFDPVFRVEQFEARGVRAVDELGHQVSHRVGVHEGLQVGLLVGRDRPVALPFGDMRREPLHALAGQVLPPPLERGFHHQPDGIGTVDHAVRLASATHGAFVAVDQLLHHPRGDDPGQVVAARGGGEGYAQADDVVRGVTHDGLVEVADLDIDAAVAIRDGADVAHVAIAADPQVRAERKRAAAVVQPFVELQRIAANVGMRRARHLEVAQGGKPSFAVARRHRRVTGHVVISCDSDR
jgi:hypothetical protein